MAYTAPGTAVAGDVLTAAFWNSNVRDNTEYLKTEADLIGIDHLNSTTLTTASSVNLNNVFSSAYTSYRIILTTTSAVTDALYNIRFRVGGVDASGANTYGYSLVQSASIGAWANLDFSNTAATSGTIGYKTATGRTSTIVDIHGPAVASPTGYTVSGQYSGIPYVGGGHHNVSTAYDGFTITAAAGNITGTLRVFGYRNS
jgi:hypothetical protein